MKLRSAVDLDAGAVGALIRIVRIEQYNYTLR